MVDGRKRTLQGFVSSDKMDKTVVVEVCRRVRDPLGLFVPDDVFRELQREDFRIDRFVVLDTIDDCNQNVAAGPMQVGFKSFQELCRCIESIDPPHVGNIEPLVL